jgi:Tol biopolymer transport system component
MPEEVVADAFHVAAAPDGSAIVFGSSIRGREGLWKTDSSGRRPVSLVSGFAVEPVVTADRAVVFVSNRSGVQSPWMVPLDGGEPAEIVPQHAYAIDVSPDGRLLAFLTVTDGVDSIVVCALPSCSDSRSLPLPPSIGAPLLRWTPNGQELAYLEGARQNIWAVPLDGGPPRALTSFGGDMPPILRFAWSADARLAFVRGSVETDVVLLTGLHP